MNIKNFINTNKFILVSVSLSLFIGFLAGGEYQKYVISNKIKEAFSDFPKGNPLNSKTEESTVSKIESENNIISKNIGDEIQLATIKAKINSINEVKMVTVNFGNPSVAPQGSKYIVLNLDVTNTTKEKFDYKGYGYLVDQENRVFERELISGATSQILYDSLIPSVKITGNLYYIVPEDSKSFKIYMLKDGTNDAFKINLK